MAEQDELTAYQRLEAALDRVWTDQTFLEFLAFQKMVYTYSWNNRLLIWIQNPEARTLFGYAKWKTLGRWVQKGEKAIGILIPYTIHVEEDGKRVPLTRFKWKNCLYDISQTDGDPLPVVPVPTLPDVGADGLFHLMRRVSENQFTVPVSVIPTGKAYGYYTKTKTIAIDEEHATGIQAVATLSHELAHHLTPEVWTMPRDEAEVIAEVAAFAVMSHFNIDISNQAVPYIATWGESKALFLKGMNIAQTITTQLIDAITKEGDLCIPSTSDEHEWDKSSPMLATA